MLQQTTIYVAIIVKWKAKVQASICWILSFFFFRFFVELLKIWYNNTRIPNSSVKRQSRVAKKLSNFPFRKFHNNLSMFVLCTSLFNRKLDWMSKQTVGSLIKSDILVKRHIPISLSHFFSLTAFFFFSRYIDNRLRFGGKRVTFSLNFAQLNVLFEIEMPSRQRVTTKLTEIPRSHESLLFSSSFRHP